jgi:S1-C subfamily serine protease
VVRVVGSACGVGIEGSGWVAAPDVVVTNAHVVAGEQDTTVQAPGRTFGLPAQVIEFDPHDDIAVLRVPGLALAPIALARSSPSGREGEIAGFPEGGPLAVDAARIGPTQVVQTNDAYGHGPVERSVTPVRGLIRSGNSGGPVLDAEGDVLTMVFAKALGSGPPSGYGVADGSILAALDRALEGRGNPGSGACAGG